MVPLPTVAARQCSLVASVLFKAECLQDNQLSNVFLSDSFLCSAPRSCQSTPFLKFCMTSCNQKDAGGTNKVFLGVQPSLQTR